MIELSRNITFGQYINNDSALTRMDPRSKLFCVILLIVVTSLVKSFIAFAGLLLLCVLIQGISRISTRYVLRSFRPFLGFLAFIFVLQVLFYAPTGQVTYLWHWGVLSISIEGLLNSVLLMIRVLFLYYLVSLFLFSTSLVDLTDGMEALLSPLQKIGIPTNAFVMVFVIALKFVPIFTDEIQRLIKAQAARGVRFDQGNLLQRARKVAPLLIPLFLSGFQRAEILSTAMEARCYGFHRGWRRSKRRQLTFTRSDLLALSTTTIACLLIFMLSIYLP
ncbi:energy-coupling factor transporter transmembrane component T family protein [Ktedonospora formicarum]|uniref:Energy-coupling factor transporter transmembrane protein EcfT n=1 Tax=Ktedonospora formicarum TaxID=2778364 RepID=A0A8J3MQT7_9CHLR|nr:energy-coupling factor transporter transmembrane component T [Ktedonospora formicarum]GHO45237.1 energy-coupling factor transporter transmembrane protein EcfT [Ktedonospora formicarum]